MLALTSCFGAIVLFSRSSQPRETPRHWRPSATVVVPAPASRRQVWVVPTNRSFVLRGVEIGAFVEELGNFAHHDKAVGEPGRDIELAAVLRTQRDPRPAAVGRRRASQVDRHIKGLATHNVAQLLLRVLNLVMQSSQDTTRRTGVVVLNEFGRDPHLGKLLLVIRLHEETARVFKDSRLNDHDIGNLRRDDFHCPAPCTLSARSAISARY